MESSRKTALITVLAAIVVGVAGFHLWRGARKQRPPKWERERLIEMIDAQSGELFSMPAEYWRENEGEGILYKNPKKPLCCSGRPLTRWFRKFRERTHYSTQEVFVSTKTLQIGAV
jgi:hypothetical protein